MANCAGTSATSGYSAWRNWICTAPKSANCRLLQIISTLFNQDGVIDLRLRAPGDASRLNTSGQELSACTMALNVVRLGSTRQFLIESATVFLKGLGTHPQAVASGLQSSPLTSRDAGIGG